MWLITDVVWLAFLQIWGPLLSGQKWDCLSYLENCLVEGRNEALLLFVSAHYLLFPPKFYFFLLDKHFVLGYNLPFRSMHLYADRKGGWATSLWGIRMIRKEQKHKRSFCSIPSSLPLAPGSYTKCSVSQSTHTLIFHTRMGSLKYLVIWQSNKTLNG